jgi:dephospho-CoA kinase
MVGMASKGKIIVIVGMTGSGKGTITDYLEKKGLPKVYFGGMVYDEVARRGLEIVKDEKFVREDMRVKDGPAVLAKRAVAKAEEYFAAGSSLVVFDGLYSWSEYKFIKEKYGDRVLFIAVFTPRARRYQQVTARRDGKRVYTEEDVERRDYEEIEGIEKGGPIAMADYTLVNDGTIEDLHDKLDKLLREAGFAT